MFKKVKEMLLYALLKFSSLIKLKVKREKKEVKKIVKRKKKIKLKVA